VSSENLVRYTAEGDSLGKPKDPKGKIQNRHRIHKKKNGAAKGGCNTQIDTKENQESGTYWSAFISANKIPI